jgi:hypothetical protein
MKCSSAALILPCLLLSACATATLVPLDAQSTVNRSYEVGEVQSATVGEPIITILSGRPVGIYTANYHYTPPGARPIPAGMKFRVVGSLGSDQWVVRNDGYNVSHNLVVDGRGFPVGWHPRSGAPSDLGGLAKPLFDRSEEIIDDDKSFRAEIIYSGISGTTLNAIYREYVNDLARPAFTQQLQYEVSKGREIAFRTIRFEVLNATNSELEVRVISDGGLPWVPKR